MYNFDRFYIGIITHNKKDDEISNYILENGAISIDSIYEKDDKNIFLSVFYKIGHDNYFNDDIYMSLNGMLDYGENNFNGKHCKMIMPFSDIVPKLGYSPSCNVTIEQVRNLFDLIFKNSNKFKYLDDKFNINDFYVGNLVLCNLKRDKDRFERTNIPEQILLQNSNSILTRVFYKGKDVPEYDYEIDFDKAITEYKTFFYKKSDNEFYNLNNFQIYKKDIDSYCLKKDDSYCYHLVPLKEVLEKNKIKSKDAVTIPKVLQFQKKLKKYN